MNKYEFIDQLDDCLVGNVSEKERRDSIEYYRNYIDDEMRKGKTEQEVLDELEHPTSIAKAIIEAKGYENQEEETYYSYEETADENYHGDPYGNTSGKVVHLEGWKSMAFLIGIIVILILLLVFAFKVFVAIVPILVPILLIYYIIKFIMNRR